MRILKGDVAVDAFGALSKRILPVLAVSLALYLLGSTIFGAYRNFSPVPLLDGWGGVLLAAAGAEAEEDQRKGQAGALHRVLRGIAAPGRSRESITGAARSASSRILPEALGGWCLLRSSKPLSGAGCGVGGGFDSHALPPLGSRVYGSSISIWPQPQATAHSNPVPLAGR